MKLPFCFKSFMGRDEDYTHMALDFALYLRHAEQERENALNARNPLVAAIHDDLARHYQAKVTEQRELGAASFTIVR